MAFTSGQLTAKKRDFDGVAGGAATQKEESDERCDGLDPVMQ